MRSLWVWPRDVVSGRIAMTSSLLLLHLERSEKADLADLTNVSGEIP